MLSYYISQLQSILYVAPVMLLAIIVHECAHGWVSDKLGDPTPRMSGRLTLNPLKHLDPMGTLCLLVFHMGWANPVPINPYYYKDRKKGLILVSLARRSHCKYAAGMYLHFAGGSATALCSKHYLLPDFSRSVLVFCCTERRSWRF